MIFPDNLRSITRPYRHPYFLVSPENPTTSVPTQNKKRQLEGVIFDWDGVIIDSHDQHERSWFMVAKDQGKTLTSKQFRATFGQRNETIIPLLGWADPQDEAGIKKLADRKEEYYRQLIKEDGIEPLRGAIGLLCALKDAGIPRAVGSSTPYENIKVVMEITGLEDLFDDVVASEDVVLGKPDPDVFLQAALRLAVEPEACAVIEDAPAGLRAAKLAGMKSVAITTTHSAESLAAEAPDHTVGDLPEVTLDVLKDLFK